jgi:hypothetical protein
VSRVVVVTRIMHQGYAIHAQQVVVPVLARRHVRHARRVTTGIIAIATATVDY